MSTSTFSDLIDTQVALEKSMTVQGQEAYQRRVQKARERGLESETTYARTLIATKTDGVAAALLGLLEDANSGKAGRRHASLKYLTRVDANAAAFIAMKVVMNTMSQEKPLTKVAVTIGQMIEDEVRCQSLREQDEKWFGRLKKQADERISYRHKRNLFVRSMNYNEVEFEEWPQLDKLRVGEKLIDLIVTYTGLFVIETFVEGATERINYIRPTPEMTEWIKKKTDRDELLCPLYEPMVIPPVKWEGPKGGGYLTRFVKPLRLVKSNLKGYQEELKHTEMPLVYDAVNAMQETAWQINGDLLAIMEELWLNGSTWSTIPSRFDFTQPICPICGGDVGTQKNHPCFVKEAPCYDEEKHKAWKSAARRVHEDNRELTSKRLQFYQGFQTAKKYTEFSEIFIPYTLDFRGRVYAVPQLNPQGPDFMKALLRFANGKPLGEAGVKWLAIHGANIAGVDKVDFQSRADWVVENEDQILAIATDPFDNRGWVEGTWLVEGVHKEMKIDKPWQFLAFCQEWAGYCQEGETFVSRMPIALDGSCSGIQHYSMALRDSEGGAAVNLLPADKPQDIYQRVGDVVKEMVEQRIAGGTDADKVLGQQWLTFGISRKVCKRPVMTYPYGSGQYGYKDQIMDDVLVSAKKEMAEAFPFEGDGFRAAVWMASLIDKALPKVVVKAAEGMAWLKTAAKLLANEGLPVTWTAPDGFPVQQVRFNTKPMRVETAINGARVRMSVAIDLPELDKHAQASGISPNFIHSMDASHLRLTVVRCAEQGVTNLALIHDSFGTLAADTDDLFRIVRESFVEMYAQVDVFEDFYREVLAQLSEENRDKLAPPPEKGDLDPEAVLESLYCFA